MTWYGIAFSSQFIFIFLMLYFWFGLVLDIDWMGGWMVWVDHSMVCRFFLLGLYTWLPDTGILLILDFNGLFWFGSCMATQQHSWHWMLDVPVIHGSKAPG